MNCWSQTRSEQNRSELGGRLWHSLGSSHPLPTPAVSQPAGPLMLLTLLGDYLGVMSFAPLSWPCAGGSGCVILPARGHRLGSCCLQHSHTMYQCSRPKFQPGPEVKHESGSFGERWIQRGGGGEGPEPSPGVQPAVMDQIQLYPCWSTAKSISAILGSFSSAFLPSDQARAWRCVAMDTRKFFPGDQH